MKNKIYAYLGVNTASIDIPIGAGSLHVEFEGGSIFNIHGYTPALTKVIADPYIQNIIEKDPRFGEEIILWSQSEDATEAAEGKKKKIVYDEPESYTEVCEILKSKHEVKATQLRSPEGARRIAASLNIEFPNWK